MRGEPVTLADMMLCRDRRAETQRQYLAKYNRPVLSFTLNIPGPIKTNPALHACFADAVRAIEGALAAQHAPVLERVEYHDKTGDELLLCFDGDAAPVKDAMTALEENTPLGRLCDIDIIGVDGQKLSRPSFRQCLICQCQAQECARARKHTVAEMQAKIEQLLKEAGY